MPHYRKVVERLYLSPFDPEDAESATTGVEWMNDPVAAENYGGPQNLVTPSGATKAFAEFMGCRFDIVLVEGNIRIGHISPHNIDHLNRNAFLGIVIGGAAHRGKGYGAAAVQLALGYGFREAGRLHAWTFRNGRYLDKLYMDILVREFAG